MAADNGAVSRVIPAGFRASRSEKGMRMVHRTLGVVLLFLVGACPSLSSAQPQPAGGEFQVNTYTTDRQRFPRVATDAASHFVVIWRSDDGQDGSGRGVFGQRYDAGGAPRGGEFGVSTYTTDDQSFPAVAMGVGGTFAVVWSSNAQDGSSQGVFGQRYDTGGAPLGSEFRVNTYTTDSQGAAVVAMDAGGSFVVVWPSSGQDGSSTGIFGQRYDAVGVPRGAEFRVNTYTTDSQDAAALAMDAGGNFVVVWHSDTQDGSSFGIFGQRYDASGVPRGVEFRVNTYTTENQSSPAVAMDVEGNFVVVWSSYSQDGNADGIFGQRYDAGGVPRGGEFRVNTYTTSFQTSPAVAMDAGGDFVVVWRSDGGQDGSLRGIFGQRYDAGGAPRGVEFQVNTYTTSLQNNPAVSMDAVGNFVVVWQSYSPDGSNYGVFGQRYGGLLPAALTVDASGNGVLEPGETVTVGPSWRNVNGGPLTFTGAASQLTGPAGAAYTLVDAAANYGTVANAAIGSCTGDCFQVAVSRPTARPATHWDVTVRETIGPDALGQTKVWTLHVGESFTDVPPVHPFYRFVETLLHVGVTAGCTATTYCPDGSTTREQMAVFLLRAKEGGGFAPPPCTTAPFPDVPCASPFAPWVQELVARGITSGCGGGLYCPTAPVTREQMAVFLLKTLEGAGFTPPPCTTASFGDVPCASPFAPWVQELVARAITAGCGGGLYCPSDPVTRGQMAVFLTKTFDLTLYGP
jgi:hypothetical protein